MTQDKTNKLASSNIKELIDNYVIKDKLDTKDLIGKFIEVGNLYEIDLDEGGGALLEVNIHIPETGSPEKIMPLIGEFDVAITPGRYFVLIPKDQEEIKTELLEIHGALLATDKNQIRGNVDINEIELQPIGLDPLKLWLIADQEGTLARFQGVVMGFILLIAIYTKGAYKSNNLPNINTSDIETAYFSTAKVNSNIWNQFSKLQPGQMALGFNEDGSGALGIDLANKADRDRGVQRVMTYSINFEELKDRGLEITRKLTPYDRRVYEACSSLWNEVTTETGQETFSLKDIHYAMGNVSNPNKTQKDKLNESLTKMNLGHIYVDNASEANAYNYPHFKYDASLLPMERITGYVDGQITDGLIHLFREPPLFTFARDRGQFSTHKIELLQTPINQTPQNLAIEDYLREQIAWMKNSKGANRSNKILFDSIYKEVGIKNRPARKRILDKAEDILNHYKKCSWIKAYKKTSDGFEIFY